MAKRKKKKGSSKTLVSVPGTSQFARFSAGSAALAVKKASSAASATSVDAPQDSSPELSLPEPLSDTPVTDLISPTVPRVFMDSPSESPDSPPTGNSLAAVEATVSGPVPPIVVEAAATEAIPNPSTEKASPTLDKKPATYASLLKDHLQLEEVGIPTQHISGAPFVLIPDESIEEAKKEFKDFIFAQFHGDYPEMGRVIGVVNALWARSGPRIFVHNIGPGVFLLRVTNPRTRELLLGRHVWNIAGFPMFVASWSPELSPQALPITSASITAEFRGVPYYLFEKVNLSRIATAVGKPIALAPETERKETFDVAKVLVRADLTKELPSKVVLGFSSGREIEIDVSYPWLPPRCMECNAYGHERIQCKLWRPVTQSGRRIPQRSVSRPRTARRSRQGRSAKPKRRDTIMLNGAPAEWMVKESSKGPIADKRGTSVLSKQEEVIPMDTKGKSVLVDKTEADKGTNVADPSTSAAGLVVSVCEAACEEGEISVGEDSAAVGLLSEGVIVSKGSVASVGEGSDSVSAVSEGLTVSVSEDSDLQFAVTEGLTASAGDKSASEIASASVESTGSEPSELGTAQIDLVSSANQDLPPEETEAPFILVRRRKCRRRAKLAN